MPPGPAYFGRRDARIPLGKFLAPKRVYLNKPRRLTTEQKQQFGAVYRRVEANAFTVSGGRLTASARSAALGGRVFLAVRR
jgi:hypothetical protein